MKNGMETRTINLTREAFNEWRKSAGKGIDASETLCDAFTEARDRFITSLKACIRNDVPAVITLADTNGNSLKEVSVGTFGAVTSDGTVFYSSEINTDDVDQRTSIFSIQSVRPGRPEEFFTLQ